MSNAAKKARKAVAKRIRDYADSIYVDCYGSERQAEFDSRIREHFRSLADTIEEEYDEDE